MQAKPYLRSVSIPPKLFEIRTDFPFNLPVLRNLGTLDFHPDVTFLVGENGSGKSTLLEAIALALGFAPEGGTLNVRLQTARDTSDLFRSLHLVKSAIRPLDSYFLRAESFYNVATYMDEVGYVQAYGGSLHARSHGEAFLTTLTKKLRGYGLYLFDEPEAALSPNWQLAALSAIHQLVRGYSQFIIATHSPILMAYPRAKILRLDPSGLTEVAYEQTEHFVVMKRFLNNYRGVLHHLLIDTNEELDPNDRPPDPNS